MEVHVDRDAFIRGLQMAHNVVEPRQTLPVLANVLLEAQGETLRMTATDLEVSVRVTGPAKVVKPGTITISARKLMEIGKELLKKADVMDAHNARAPQNADDDGRRRARDALAQVVAGAPGERLIHRMFDERFA